MSRRAHQSLGIAGLIGLLTLSLGPACEEQEPPSSTPAKAKERATAQEAPPARPPTDEAPSSAREEEEPPPPPPEPEPKPLDEMSEGELEAACFAGRDKACDRLGH